MKVSAGEQQLVLHKAARVNLEKVGIDIVVVVDNALFVGTKGTLESTFASGPSIGILRIGCWYHDYCTGRVDFVKNTSEAAVEVVVAGRFVVVAENARIRCGRCCVSGPAPALDFGPVSAALAHVEAIECDAGIDGAAGGAHLPLLHRRRRRLGCIAEKAIEWVRNAWSLKTAVVAA